MVGDDFVYVYDTLCHVQNSGATPTYEFRFFFFFRSCGVVCEAFYSLKNAQGSGRGSFAEGCPSRKVAEGDVGKIQRIE